MPLHAYRAAAGCLTGGSSMMRAVAAAAGSFLSLLGPFGNVRKAMHY